MINVQAICAPLKLEGAIYKHRTVSGITRRLREPAGDGWTWRVSGPKAALVALGAYEATGGVWLLPVGNGDPIQVWPL